MSTNVAGVNASFYRKYHRNLINYVFIHRVIICWKRSCEPCSEWLKDSRRPVTASDGLSSSQKGKIKVPHSWTSTPRDSWGGDWEGRNAKTASTILGLEGQRLGQQLWRAPAPQSSLDSPPLLARKTRRLFMPNLCYLATQAEGRDGGGQREHPGWAQREGAGVGWGSRPFGGARSRYAALSKHARQFGSDIIVAPAATHLQAEHTLMLITQE